MMVHIKFDNSLIKKFLSHDTFRLWSDTLEYVLIVLESVQYFFCYTW